jgi:hypothetical protein
MERIGVETLLHCESRQTSSRSWLTKELTESSREEIANERGAIYVCSLRPCSAMGADRLVSMRAEGQETVGAYRQGNTGRPSWQGESLAMAADPLVLRSSVGCEASDTQQGQEHVGCGQSNLANPGIQIQGHRHTAAARVSDDLAPPPPSADLAASHRSATTAVSSRLRQKYGTGSPSSPPPRASRYSITS